KSCLSCFYCWYFFIPSVTTFHLPYILRCKTPRSATGCGKGRSEMFRMLQGLAGGGRELFQ
uniref:hypothetical protein n=1 Tax=Barnesiella intestinihominis TaxID=487174 RepID=UPI003FED4AC5